MKVAGTVGGGREADLHVDGIRELAVGHPREIPLAEVFHGGDIALHRGDLFLHAFDDLVDGFFLAAIIEDEGRAVVAFDLGHCGLFVG